MANGFLIWNLVVEHWQLCRDFTAKVCNNSVIDVSNSERNNGMRNH